MKTSQGWSPDMLVGLLEALGLLLVSRFFLFFVVAIISALSKECYCLSFNFE